MTQRTPTPRLRPSGEDGFTLIELLVVIVIIGILAGIALPAFLNQRKQGQDADAKSNARSLATQVESCRAEKPTYTLCDSKTELEKETPIDIDYGSGPSQAQVDSAGEKNYAITAVSKADTGGARHRFTLTKSSAGDISRTCTTGGSSDDGGCNDGTW